MRRYLLLSLSLCTAPAGAGIVLDQHQTAWTTDAPLAVAGGSQQMLAQTFVAGMSGTLDKLQVVLNCGHDSTGLVSVGLHTFDADGRPTADVLGQVSVASTLLAGSGHAVRDLYMPPVAITNGTGYAIVVRGQDGVACSLGGAVDGGSTSGYPRGEAFFDAHPNPPGWVPFHPHADLAFWVWIRTGTTGAPGFCDFEDASGVGNDWLPNRVPVCACLEDRAGRANRCWFALPDAIVWRELPWPLPESGRGRYSALPLSTRVDMLAIEDVGLNGGYFADPVSFGKGLEPGKTRSANVRTWNSGKDVSIVRIRFDGPGGAGEAIFRTRLDPLPQDGVD